MKGYKIQFKRCLWLSIVGIIIITRRCKFTSAVINHTLCKNRFTYTTVNVLINGEKDSADSF